MFVYDLIITTSLVLAANTTGAQPIELYGLYLGFIFPVLQGALHLAIKMTLVRGLLPSSSQFKTGSQLNLADNARHLVRDTERDSLRDTERDEGRDIDRDMDRDRMRDKLTDSFKNVVDTQQKQYALTRNAEREADKAQMRAERHAERTGYKEEDRVTRVDERTDHKEEDKVTRGDERTGYKEEDRVVRVSELNDERDIRHTDEHRRESYEGDHGKTKRTEQEMKDDPESVRQEKIEGKEEENNKERAT